MNGQPPDERHGSSDAENPPRVRRRRRWYQFGLRTLLILIALCALGAFGWRTSCEPYHQQRSTMALIAGLGGTYQTAEASPWMRRVLGSDLQNVVVVDLADCDNPSAFVRAIAALPRLETLVVGGSNVGDDELHVLQRAPALRHLVLDSTHVTEQAIATLHRDRPELTPHRSDRRAIAALRELADVRSAAVDVPTDLRGPVGEYFIRCQEVSFYWASDADLRYLIPLTDLRVLTIRGGRVSDAGLAQVEGLRELQTLTIQGTQFSDAGLVHLQPLSQLQRLGLNATQMSDAGGLETLQRLPSLRHLALHGADLGDAGLAQLGRLENLQTLDLSRTKITDAGLAQLRTLHKLEWLSLGATQIGDSGLAHLQGLLKLNHLELYETRIQDAGLAFLQPLQQLRHLYLYDTKIGDRGLAQLPGLHKLEVLYLGGTQITDAGLVHLRSLRKLERLGLLGTEIGDAGIAHLKALPKLRDISVIGTRVTEVGIRVIGELPGNQRSESTVLGELEELDRLRKDARLDQGRITRKPAPRAADSPGPGAALTRP